MNRQESGRKVGLKYGSENGRKYGPANGRKNGSKNAASGHMRKLGLERGRENVETGFLASIKTPESLANGGKTQGGKNAVSGHLNSIRTYESTSKGAHVTWHVNRGIKNPNCDLCWEGEADGVVSRKAST